MKRVALYVRVSTSKQESTGRFQTTESQINDLTKLASFKNYEIVQIYQDVGISGTLSNRPALDQLMADAELGKFDAVMVWRFDRFARNIKHLLQGLEFFKSKNIDFLSLSENIDTSSSIGMMVFTILGAVAQFERDMISERVKAGLRNARAKGKRIGQQKVLDKDAIWNKYLNTGDKNLVAKQLGVSWASVHRVVQDRTPLVAS